MASKTCNEKCGTRVKGGTSKETQNNLEKKIQLDFQKDILRLFQDSVYCDVKFTVESSSLLAHSCILRARASRFYTFVRAEFDVFERDGITVYNICNASFTCLQTFVENIYTNLHSVHAEEKIIKHLKERKRQTLEVGKVEAAGTSARTPESDLFFTPRCSPSELQKPFASSKLKAKENDVASYYKIASVDDIPAEEKLEESGDPGEEKAFEKELAEQDELLSSFQTILSRKSTSKPNSLSLGACSQSGKKAKPRFNRKFEANFLLVEERKRYSVPHWKPNPLGERSVVRGKYLGVRAAKKTNVGGVRSPEKAEVTGCLEEPSNSVCSSDMDVSATGGDSGLEVSATCQQEASPRETTMSETSGVDLTEAGIHEDIPNDETISGKQSSGSSASSDAGTWEANGAGDSRGDFSAEEIAGGRQQLDQEEINRLDEMEKNMKDCEMFLYMERKASACDERCNLNQDHSKADEEVPGSVSDVEAFRREATYQYAKERSVSNREECWRGETGHGENGEGGENDYKYGYREEKNFDDAINLEDGNEGKVDANEAVSEGVAGESMNSKSDYFVQPDILRDVKEARTPPCTPKKPKGKAGEEEEREPGEEEEGKSRCWENNNNNSSGVSNYFIDASSLLDETEILTPPISLINFKSPQGFEEGESGREKSGEEEGKTVSKKVVSNFYSREPSDDVSLKENERRQGDIIFRNSIPHYSKHEIEENHGLESSERLRGGGEDEGEQVVPSADIEFSPPEGSNHVEKCSFVVRSEYPEPGIVSSDRECEATSRDHVDGAGPFPQAKTREPAVEMSSSSVSSGSPNLRRRNESAPIVSGGMDFVEEEKRVQRKPSQSQGEAWIVTFDDERRTKSRPTESRGESRGESGEEGRLQSVHIGEQRRRREGEESGEGRKAEQGAFPVQKSNSSGYFLDLSKESGDESIEQPSQGKAERKNMFSMFIGMDDNSNETFLRRKPTAIEREGTFDKSLEDSSRGTTKSETPEERKKPFYMFIESDSPNVKRRQMPRKANRETEPFSKRNLIRTQSYTIEQEPESSTKPEVRTDIECSSSDNSLPYPESSSRPRKGRLPLPLNKLRGADSSRDGKITAWSETKHSTDSTSSTESWLRSKDVQVNYRGKDSERFRPKRGTDDEDDYKHSGGHKNRDSKPRERDSGVVLSDKGEDSSFVRLSDLDSSGRLHSKTVPTSSERMSKSISEERTGKAFSGDGDTRLSKSIESEGSRPGAKSCGLYERGVNRSLIRLFPNLSAQSLARMVRKEGDTQRSETSEVSSSMQSSIEPSGLEISTSETDVSTHAGTSSKLGEDLLKMFLEEISPDVVIEVKGRRIKAHKCILSSRCQYFAGVLSGGWVESAGNVIPLQGFSYNAVHFALRYIYSGESRIPESLSIVELMILAEMLCLDGLQEIISYNIKVKYCHSFHVPCSVCIAGVTDCLPFVATCGLDDLHRKCLRWITKYFVKIWPTKCFGSMPEELLEECYEHHVLHMTVDNVLDTVLSIDKVRGSLPNVRWAESVSRLVDKLHGATVKYIAEHFSSLLTSDSFLALGKEAGWNVSRLEDSIIETVKYLSPEQACWSYARLHRILTFARGFDPPPEMVWNENFLKFLQVIAELVENSLIKQAPRAAKSKAWGQMEPELRSKIQEAACLVLPVQDHSAALRRSNNRDNGSPVVAQTARSRNFEIRQMKLAMSQQTANKNPTTKRPLSLQMEPRLKKDSRFIPLRPSVSTSSVRRNEPRTEGIRKTQSRSQISNTSSEPKKTFNPKYSEVKSRYLEPKSPLKNASEKPVADANHRRTSRYISSSDSSRNCSPSLRTSSSRSSIPQPRKPDNLPRQTRSSVLRSGSATTLYARRDKSSSRTDVKSLNRLTKDENPSTDSLCTDSLASEKEATIRRRPGKENLVGRTSGGNPICKSNSNSPISRRHSSESWSSATSKTNAVRKLTTPKPQKDTSRSNPPKRATGHGPAASDSAPTSNACRPNVPSTRTTTTTTERRNQRNAGRVDASLVNGNVSRKRNEVDAENNRKNTTSAPVQPPSAVERSGTFLKEEPTILKKPQVGAEA